MKKLLLFATLILASCGPQSSSKAGKDGYIFGDKQYTQKELRILVTEYPTRQEFLKAANAKGIKAPDVVAFSILNAPKFDTCKVHIVDPKVVYEPEFLGHEFAHCIYGQWHTNNDSFK